MDALAAIDSDLQTIEFGQDIEARRSTQKPARKLLGPQMKTGLSPGTREQVHLLARIIICRFLSARNSMAYHSR